MNHLEIKSNLLSLVGEPGGLSVRVNEKKELEAMAFFDLDGTLIHLEDIYQEAIVSIFPEIESKDLIETFVRGFKLGNSFREFDRMHEIFVRGNLAWKDPEIYIKERLEPEKEKIDQPGGLVHERAKRYLKEYGEAAKKIAERIYQTDHDFFKKAEIGPIFKLLEIYKNSGYLMFGFTANAGSFVQDLVKYLGLENYFLDIATDETMEGGGKEVAIVKMLKMAKEKDFSIKNCEIIFVGDSIRGDIGSGVKFLRNYPDYRGKGILVLENHQALLETRHLVNTDPKINSIIQAFPVFALVTSEVPKNAIGEPSILSREMNKFLFRL